MLFRLDSESQLLSTFRRIDQKHVEPPHSLAYPITFRHYTAWSDPSGHRTFLIFSRPQWAQPRGIVFRRFQSPTPSSAAMCDWCHAYGATDEIGLLSADVDPNRRVGVHLCLDLSCQQRIENIPGLPPQRIKDLTEQLMRRMARFSRDALGIPVQTSAAPPQHP